MSARAINHVMVVRDELADDRERMHELFSLFRRSRDLAGTELESTLPPMGFGPNRRSLEVAIAAAESQRLLAQPLALEDLVTDILASLE